MAKRGKKLKVGVTVYFVLPDANGDLYLENARVVDWRENHIDVERRTLFPLRDGSRWKHYTIELKHVHLHKLDGLHDLTAQQNDRLIHLERLKLSLRKQYSKSMMRLESESRRVRLATQK